MLAFLGRTSFAAEARAGGILVIHAPAALEKDLARAELGIYLRMWERLTPGAGAEVRGES